MGRPRVIYTQADLSQYIAGSGETVAIIVGNAKWGPIELPQLISSYSGFVELFGKPVSPTDSEMHYQALGYFKRGKNLIVVRSQGASEFGGVEGIAATETAGISAGLDTLPVVPSATNVVGFYDKYPGIHDEVTIYTDVVSIDVATGTLTVQVGTRLANSVIDPSDPFYEEHFVSVITGTKDGFGRSSFIVDVLDRDSKLIVGRAKADAAVTDVPAINTTPVALANESYTLATPTEIQATMDLLKSLSFANFSLIIPGEFTETTLDKAIEIADLRQDCFAVLSPSVTETWTLAGIGTPGWLDVLASRTWRAGAWGSYVKERDEYNDNEVFVPVAGLVAGAIAYSDFIADIFYAPAGPIRGQIGATLGIEWTEAEQDALYDQNINFAAKSVRTGTTIEGQKTLSTTTSALDRINVARLMIQVREDTIVFLKNYMYEFNNELNRSLIQNGLQAYLDDWTGKGAFYNAVAVCDDSNNPDEVIDRNELKADIYVQPVKAAEFLYLGSTITSSGINLDDIVATSNV